MKIFDILPVGEENAISAKALSAKLGLSVRECRATEVLENYHTIPAVDWKRLFIDRILETSRNIAHNEQEKRYHNLIILRYIAAERLSTQKICKMLHINRDRPNYDAITAHAIDRLLVLAFGTDGINWNDTST